MLRARYYQHAIGVSARSSRIGEADKPQVRANNLMDLIYKRYVGIDERKLADDWSGDKQV